jgi:hypothetical protein
MAILEIVLREGIEEAIAAGNSDIEVDTAPLRAEVAAFCTAPPIVCRGSRTAISSTTI